MDEKIFGAGHMHRRLMVAKAEITPDDLITTILFRGRWFFGGFLFFHND
jgi:hypothetical protein